MKPKTLLYVAFALVALAQLFVPCLMISTKADIALAGKEFQFKIDNNHSGSSINGNYLWFRFEANKYKVTDKKDWERSQSVYVTFIKDSLGFAKIQSVSKKQPVNNNDWVKARAFLNYKDSSSLQLTYPFNNYYIENTNLRDIEKIVTKKLNDSLRIISLKVNIKENQFLVKDLMVDGLTFKEFVKGLKKR